MKVVSVTCYGQSSKARCIIRQWSGCDTIQIRICYFNVILVPSMRTWKILKELKMFNTRQKTRTNDNNLLQKNGMMWLACYEKGTRIIETMATHYGWFKGTMTLYSMMQIKWNDNYAEETQCTQESYDYSKTRIRGWWVKTFDAIYGTWMQITQSLCR